VSREARQTPRRSALAGQLDLRKDQQVKRIEALLTDLAKSEINPDALAA
jgi:hypothetical protein